ncbi:MAG: hypothetical protein R2745_21815 [Vicinamibacterales bacterium]
MAQTPASLTLGSWASAALLALACTSCGGGGGGSQPPPGTGNPPTSSPTNPCATALAADADLPFVEPFNSTAAAVVKRENLRGRTKGDVRDALWLHRAPRGGREVIGPLGDPNLEPAAVVQDAGDISVIQDDGSIFVSANVFDLANNGLRFRPNGAGYEVSKVDATFRTALGSRLALSDDDSVRVALPAAVSYYGASLTEAFVNSDGNITFGAGDNASSDRSVGRFLAGAPRVAGFFADLDPSAGGRVFANAEATGLTVTWCQVPGFDSTATITMQATVQTDGTVDVKFGAVGLGTAVIGVSPGTADTFTPVDLSAANSPVGGQGAVGERFTPTSDADLVAAAQSFYRTHPDQYDQLVFWGETRLIPLGEAFAQEFTVANAVQGIGVPRFDSGNEFGGARRLQSVVNMDRILKYPQDPAQKFLGEDSVLSLLGQESGHRWLAFLQFIDHNRQRSNALLGRDDAHWSFFSDSDASVMEGNDIQDLGGGSFRTVGTVSRYSLLDQYAMGLIPPQQVPSFFYVEAPVNVVPGRDKASSPETGVTFNGTRRDVLIQDVISAMGDRVPPSIDAPKVWRQAWIYIVRSGSTARTEDLATIDGWRTAWEAFFLQATDGRMRLDAKLR